MNEKNPIVPLYLHPPISFLSNFMSTTPSSLPSVMRAPLITITCIPMSKVTPGVQYMVIILVMNALFLLAMSWKPPISTTLVMKKKLRNGTTSSLHMKMMNLRKNSGMLVCLGCLHVKFVQWITFQECDSLTKEDIDNLIMFNIKLTGHISRKLHNYIHYAYQTSLGLSSPYRLHHQMAKLAYLPEVVYHCCIHSCCTFTGANSDLDSCPYCRECHYNDSVAPHQLYCYTLLLPHIQSMYLNVTMAHQLSY